MAKKSAETKATKANLRQKPTHKTKPAKGITTPTELCMIALDQLRLSPDNVRKVPASATDNAELLASICENGIKQNLVVHASGENTFYVDAGGRRLNAGFVAKFSTYFPLC